MPRVLLLSKPKNVPMLWRVLANKYSDKLVFASHKDWSGKSSKKMGLPVGKKKDSKVLVYPVGSIEPVLYEGTSAADPQHLLCVLATKYPHPSPPHQYPSRG